MTTKKTIKESDLVIGNRYNKNGLGEVVYMGTYHSEAKNKSFIWVKDKSLHGFGLQTFLTSDLKDFPTPVRSGSFWVNVYECSEVPHSTRELADGNAGRDRLACVAVAWKEEDGLE